MRASSLRNIGVLTGAVTVLSLMSVPGHRMALAAEGCVDRWSPPETLRTRPGALVTIDRPTGAARMDQSLVLAGAGLGFGLPIGGVIGRLDTTLSDLERDPAPSFGVRALVGGLARPLPAPAVARNRLAVYPVSGPEPGIVWAEARDSLTAQGFEGIRVWYARREGIGWRSPELVMEGRSITWGYGLSAVIAGDGTIVVAAPAEDATWRGILVAQRGKQGWKADRLEINDALGAIGVTLARHGGRTSLFYRDHMRRDTSLAIGMFRRDLGKDAKWGSPTVLRELAPGVVNWPQAVSTNDGILHLFWAHWTESREYQIQHAWTSAGRAWKFDSLPIAEHPFDLAAAALDGGTARIVVGLDVPRRIQTATWGDSAFGNWASLPFVGTAKALMPRLTAIDSHSLVMSWIQYVSVNLGGQTIQWPTTLIARETLLCTTPKRG